MIQRRVGGNLSEILSNVANTIRERRELRQEVLALTARQRLTANFGALLPIFVAFLLFLLNPDTTKLLVTETAGRIALIAGIGFELLGLWLIRRLAVIEV
jgi:tight adherence protein B